VLPSAWEEVQAVIDGLAEQAAFIGTDGTILAVNKRWRRQTEKQARAGLAIHRDYDAFLSDLVDKGDIGARPILEALRNICAGARDNFTCLYRGSGAFSGYDFNVAITAVTVHDERYLLVTVHDVTELVLLKRQRRRLGSQLLRAQEAERRRMARDLHDSTAQSLVALQFSLHRLSLQTPSAEAQALISECKEAIQEVHREIRAISFIAHPQSPAAVGLQNALERLVEGFAKRVGFQIEIECSNVGDASASVETTIFRLTQEGLSNIHRHARASAAHVRLIGRDRYLHLLIWDDGVGFDWARKKGGTAMGVGVMGMVERVRDLGGRLSLTRLEQGMLLRASLPRLKASAAAG
jgi:signal transduction histidine kinase